MEELPGGGDEPGGVVHLVAVPDAVEGAVQGAAQQDGGQLRVVDAVGEGGLESGQFADLRAVANALSGGGAPEIVARTPAATRAAADQALHAAFAAGLDRVFLICGVAGVVAGVVVLLLVRPAQATARVAAVDDGSAGASPGGPVIPAPGDGGQMPTGANG
ncbi:hypothetical protein [Parafrankia discariae]|uniref:hypothetical protein n=1 Tax=Parafrankia discariae TaxID=365528 RepID=UPI0003756A8C|nr:hypothetical protein [Parafrankia discariae]